jgi:hypothetical protein
MVGTVAADVAARSAAGAVDGAAAALGDGVAWARAGAFAGTWVPPPHPGKLATNISNSAISKGITPNVLRLPQAFKFCACSCPSPQPGDSFHRKL